MRIAVRGWHVAVTNGVVQLSGTINSKTGKQRAGTIAESITGIASVHNHLKVVASQEPPSDLTVKYGVKNRLFWSSFVDDKDVAVVVDEGRVTLTGAVDDRAAFDYAAQAANEAGAKEVRNRLWIRDRFFHE